MGAMICHNLNSQKKRNSFVKALDQLSQSSIMPQNNLDLPYRHYISKNLYIPSALFHSSACFPRKNKIQISKSIKQSSIMMRRFSEKIQDPQFLQISGVQIQI